MKGMGRGNGPRMKRKGKLKAEMKQEDIPSTADTPSPDVSLGNALILVHPSRYELGSPCPKFSGRQEVLAYQHENRYLHSIILIYKLRKLSMLFPTSPSLTEMNPAY